jgi:hypothetical protein
MKNQLIITVIGAIVALVIPNIWNKIINICYYLGDNPVSLLALMVVVLFISFILLFFFLLKTGKALAKSKTEFSSYLEMTVLNKGSSKFIAPKRNPTAFTK